jgi:hypothetical protein
VLDKIHRVFPFLGNILTPYGVGPITLTDVYWGENPVQPDAHPGFWILIEIVLIVLAAAWVIRWRRRSQNHLESTLTDFALIFTFLTFFTAVQAYHYAIFDRYYEPALIGCLIWLSAGSVNLAETTRRMKGALTFILLFFAVFSVAGVHDLFAWNHSRWALFQRAVSRGVAISEIDGGYELNGWFAFEEGRPNAVSPGCGLVQPWYCGHRSYQIVMGAGNDAVVVDSEPVRSWMGRYPDLQLIRISK